MEVFITAFICHALNGLLIPFPRIFWPVMCFIFLLFIASIPITYNKVGNTMSLNNYIEDEYTDGKSMHGFTVVKKFKKVGGKTIEEVKFY